MKIQSLPLIVSLFCITECNVTDEHSSASTFAIYRLEDSTLVASQVWDLPLDSLKLARTPFLPQDSLKSYKWHTHEFVTTASIDTELACLGRRLGPTGGIPFVVTVGRDRIYLGGFWWAYSSLAPKAPFIEVDWNFHQIQKGYDPNDTVDVRNDPRIYIALKNAGVLVE